MRQRLTIEVPNVGEYKGNSKLDRFKFIATYTALELSQFVRAVQVMTDAGMVNIVSAALINISGKLQVVASRY